MKRVAVLGCTGSIGTQTLDVIKTSPGDLQVVALAAHSNKEKLNSQAAEFRVAKTALFVEGGMSALLDLVTGPEVDVVVISVAGMIGLEPTLAALDAGKHVALASKEVLVAGGALVKERLSSADSMCSRIRPIDSEHSAILQCLVGHSIAEVEKLILTASGGPFRGWTRGEMQGVTAAQALNHPTWRMGGKITVDSATMMNKGLELIEACWLFDVRPEQVEVIVHPQSVIHSMVKFVDGSVLAQMGHPDMKLPIQYALLGPTRLPSPAKNWEPLHTPNLEFSALDESAFPLPGMAREAFRRGGVTPAFVNAANEEAANAFIRSEIGFLDIERSVEWALSNAPCQEASLDSVLRADAASRSRWREALGL
jgi:1-deoxy-D-xylulose-5-phosphate reductoisomerase